MVWLLWRNVDRGRRRRTRALTGRLNVIRNEGRTEIRRNFWSVRVCDQWNSLPDHVKEQETTNGFKNALDNFMFGQQR